MPSIIPGYEYDIFISYRQNDNQDGWVTEFVESLNREIKATFKEDISIYFDENPHDGLHEHHEVDDSLKEKLKCLIFIPIVSQTYCDPNCFAWEHEFKVFVEQARDDEFGLKTKLSGGNVASRMLPVKIHDLDDEDQQLFESEVGGVMRSIDFIYKDTGVNRPLRADEEFPEENLNHTIFRNQVNKVANAIKNIINGIIASNQPEVNDQSPTTSKTNKLPTEGYRYFKSKQRIIYLIVFALIVFLAFYFYYPKEASVKRNSKFSIAILPLSNYSGNSDNDHIGLGLANDIRILLTKTKVFKNIISEYETIRFLNSNTQNKDIGNELNVDFVFAGNFRAEQEKFKVSMELFDVENGNIEWNFDTLVQKSSIWTIRNKIVSGVTKKLSNNELESFSINKSLATLNPDSYNYYSQGLSASLRLDRIKACYIRNESSDLSLT